MHLSNSCLWTSHQTYLPKFNRKKNHYLIIVDVYSKIPKLYGMENITTEEVKDKLDMFQARFVKVYEFGWCNMDIIQNDTDI